jgi:hypothetical protein
MAERGVAIGAAMVPVGDEGLASHPPTNQYLSRLLRRTLPLPLWVKTRFPISKPLVHFPREQTLVAHADQSRCIDRKWVRALSGYRTPRRHKEEIGFAANAAGCLDFFRAYSRLRVPSRRASAIMRSSCRC